MKKRIISLVLAVVMLAALGVTSFAAVTVDPNGFTNHIQGWAGSGKISLLMGHGNGAKLTVGTDTSVNADHYWLVETKNNGYLIGNGATNNPYYINIYRVLQNNTYYNATGYVYESYNAGRDQIVDLLQGDGKTYIKLDNPIMGGNWYMMADFSSPVPLSDVVWYTNPNGYKALWQ